MTSIQLNGRVRRRIGAILFWLGFVMLAAPGPTSTPASASEGYQIGFLAGGLLKVSMTAAGAAIYLRARKK